jgi:hypothetical protein
MLGAPLLLCLASCASPAASSNDSDAERPAMLASLPSDVETRARVDFGSTLELLGWDVEPRSKVSADAAVKVRLYARLTKPPSPGWKLALELIGPGGETLASDVGQASPGPEDLVPGALHLLERTLTVPSDVPAGSLALTASLVRAPVQVEGAEIPGLSSLRMPILSGLSDGRQRAVLARLATEASSGEKRAKGQKKRTGERRPGVARGPRPALSALQRALPMPSPSGVVQKENP